jgi:hypothetical protein
MKSLKQALKAYLDTPSAITPRTLIPNYLMAMSLGAAIVLAATGFKAGAILYVVAAIVAGYWAIPALWRSPKVAKRHEA